MLRLSLQARGCAAAAAAARPAGARTVRTQAKEGNRQAVAIASTTPIRRSDVESWLGSLEPPIGVKPSALARRYDKYMVPMDWVVDCPDAVEALKPVAEAMKMQRNSTGRPGRGRDGGGENGAAHVTVPPIGLAMPTIDLCQLPNAKPGHGHDAVIKHPERVVHLSGLQQVDIGYFGRDRVPLVAGWVTELGFDVSNQSVKSVRGQERKQHGGGNTKHAITGRYLVTLPSAAEAERLGREMHGRKYLITSKLWDNQDKEVQVSACLMG